MHIFQKDASPRSKGWPIEFFLGFYDILKEDLLRLINKYRVSRRMSVSFNSTFIVLIPKYDNLVYFDQYKPISLCNCICKIISEVIALIVKKLLS
jgi:hypothetical protein